MTTSREHFVAGDIVRELQERGAVCLPGFFDRATAEDMRREALELLSDPIDGVKKTNIPGGPSVVINKPAVLNPPRFPALGRALRSDLLKNVSMGYDPKGTFFTRAHITQSITPAKITDIHFDSFRFLKFMVYLSDVDRACAALRYCFGSHLDNRNFRYRFLRAGGKIIDLPNVPAPSETVLLEDLEGPQGTLIIFDSDGFHSAGTLQPGKERLLIRTHTKLSGWFNNETLRRVAEFNPLKFFVPSMAPGRSATGGRTRANERGKYRMAD
jgi:hypothetical protein